MDGSGTDDRDPSERELAERLRHLGDKLGSLRPEERAGKAEGPSDGDPSGLGKAMRLSSEFMAGVIAGGLLGYAFDHFLATSPGGMIVFVMLGFGAGLTNLMRASGMIGRRSDPG